MIFSHGTRSNWFTNSNNCVELASNGCIVYAIDHTDLSCSCTYSKNGGYQLYKDFDMSKSLNEVVDEIK